MDSSLSLEIAVGCDRLQHSQKGSLTMFEEREVNFILSLFLIPSQPDQSRPPFFLNEVQDASGVRGMALHG